MDERGLTVTDIVADTKIHSNTVYSFLKGNPVLQSTEVSLTRWVAEQTRRKPVGPTSG